MTSDELRKKFLEFFSARGGSAFDGEKETKAEKVEEALVQISKNLEELSQLQKTQIERQLLPAVQSPISEISSEQEEFFEITEAVQKEPVKVSF